MHYTQTELVHDTKSGTLTCSFAAPILDLEKALHGMCGKNIELDEDDEDCAAALERFLRKHLTLRRGKQTLSFRWVGWECGEQSAWLHVEFRGVPSLLRCTFQLTAFADLSEDEFFHVVDLRAPGRRARQTLHRKSPRMQLF